MENTEPSFLDYSNWNMFIYQEVEMNEYPGFDNQRKKFKSKMKDAIEERKETTRLRIIGGYCILALFVLFLILLVILYNYHYIGIYNGLNKGIYFLNCGFEFVGSFGAFCD